MEDNHEITVYIGDATLEADAFSIDKQVKDLDQHRHAHGITQSNTQYSVELENVQLAPRTSRGELLDELTSAGHNECSEK